MPSASSHIHQCRQSSCDLAPILGQLEAVRNAMDELATYSIVLAAQFSALLAAWNIKSSEPGDDL